MTITIFGFKFISNSSHDLITSAVEPKFVQFAVDEAL